MSRRARVALACAALVAGAAAPAACVDLGALQTGLDAGDAPDGAPLADGAARADGAPLADAAPGADAGVDARFCVNEGPHFLCADWDDVGTADVGWDTNVVSGGAGGGAIARDLTTSVSPPASFSSSVANGSTMGGTYATLVKRVTPHPASITFAADVRASATGGTAFMGNASFLGFQDIAPNDAGSSDFYGTGVGLDPNGAGLSFGSAYMTADGGYAEYHAALPPLGAGWTRVVISIDYGPPEHLRVSYDGVPEVDATIADVALPPGAQLSALLGIISVAGGALHASYDNVTIDVK